MNEKIHIVTVFALLMALLASNAFAAPEYPLLDELFSLPEDQIDIGLVALKLAKEVYPDLDVDDYSKKIENMQLWQSYSPHTGQTPITELGH